MATPENNNKTMEYDKTMYKKAEKKNHLAGRVNKFQEKVNQTQAPAKPVIHHVHEQQELDPNMINEIKHIYQLVKDNGQQGDYAHQLPFGELVTLYGPNVNRLVEILSIARDHGYMNYSSSVDVLQQERDEEIFVKLIKQPY